VKTELKKGLLVYVCKYPWVIQLDVSKHSWLVFVYLVQRKHFFKACTLNINNYGNCSGEKKASGKNKNRNQQGTMKHQLFVMND